MGLLVVVLLVLIVFAVVYLAGAALVVGSAHVLKRFAK